MFGPYRIRLCWVQGHSGIVDNETADALARLGSAFQTIFSRRSLVGSVLAY